MSAGSDSSKFTRVNPGDDIRGVSRSERIMALQNTTRSQINGEPYSPSGNLNRIIGPGWVIHRQRRRQIFGGVGVTLPRTPFQIIARTIGVGVNQRLQLGVIQDSHLFNSEDKDTYEEDNSDWGLLDVDEESGWTNVTTSDIGKKFWLQVRLDSNQSIQGIDLRYGFPGFQGSWLEFPDQIGINTVNPQDPFQQFYNQIIGEISNPDIDPREGLMTLTIPNSNGTRIQVNQLLFDDIFMTTGHTAQDANEPDIPVIVNSSPYQPATDTGGTGTPIPSDSNLMTPWQFGPSVDVNDYSFKMFNVSTFPAGGGEQFRVLILDGDVINESDGSRHTPAGMGNDDLVRVVNDDGDEIWLEIHHDNTFNIVDPITVHAGTTTPDDTDLVSYITIGQVFIDFSDEPPLLTPHNTVCGDIVFTQPADAIESTRYSFQMFDASDSSGQKVKIIDGDVIDQDDVVWTPTGMGNDDFIIPVFDNSDVYIQIPHDHDFNITANPTIHNTADTPDDTPTNSYITLGYINFNFNVDPPTVDPHNSVCGDIRFDAPAEINNYSFKMVDASTGDNAQVRVMDGLVIDSEGQEFQPGGMGNDQLVLQANDGWDVYLEIRFNQNTGAILDVQVHTSPQTPFDLPHGRQHVTLGKVFVDDTPNGPFVLGVNHICGDFFFDWDLPSQYAFQMFDGSLTDGTSVQAAVRIADGYVSDNYGNKIQPPGMGTDTLTLPVSDGYEVYLKIKIDDSTNRIDGPVTIEVQPATPDDDDNFMYVTIGTAYVDQDGVFPVNAICGDFFIDPPVNRLNFNFQIEDASIGGQAQVRIYDGSVIGPNDDPKDPDGMPSDNSYIIPVSDGDEIWVGVQWNMETDDGVSGDNIESVWIGNGAGTPFDEGLIQYITIGHVEVGDVFGVPFVAPFNEICGDIIIEFPPSLESDELLQLSVDKDTKNVVWKTSKIAQVTTEDASGYSGDGQDFLDDIDVLTFNEEDFDLFDGGGGQAIVKLTSAHGFSVQGDAGFVDDVNHIQFTIAEDPSAGFINVTDGGDGVAIVEIPVLPTTGTGTQVLGSDDGDIQWFGTDTCTD